MTRALTVLAALGVSGAAIAPAVAQAQPLAPQPGSECPSGADGALTMLPDDAGVLECRAGRWQSYTDPYPSSDRWFTYGPTTTLHGQGMRNPEVISGHWTAYPQEPNARCRAEQVAVVSAGEVGSPQTSDGETGAPLHFEVVPAMFTIELSGDCLWQKDGSQF
jgi:hypothetical protein